MSIDEKDKGLVGALMTIVDLDEGVHSVRVAKQAVADYESSKTEPSDNGWRPIETAPKDGKPILVWWPEQYHYPFVCFWADKWSYGLGWKWMGWGDVLKGQPECWMPLPQPPKGDGA